MSPRSAAMIFLLLFFVFVVCNISSADETSDNQMVPSMTPVSPGQSPSNTNAIVPAESLNNWVLEFIAGELKLISFEAGLKGDLSICQGDGLCQEAATMIQTWLCVADTCQMNDSTKNPLDCFSETDQKSFSGEPNVIASVLCDLVKSPSPITRKEVLRHLSDPFATEDALVEVGGFIMALKDSGEACTNYLKNYVGPYGPKWTKLWYGALSGCRILSRERTRKEEEKDFSLWYMVTRGWGRCEDIINNEIREACDAGGVLFFDGQGEEQDFSLGGREQFASF